LFINYCAIDFKRTDTTITYRGRSRQRHNYVPNMRTHENIAMARPNLLTVYVLFRHCVTFVPTWPFSDSGVDQIFPCPSEHRKNGTCCYRVSTAHQACTSLNETPCETCKRAIIDILNCVFSLSDVCGPRLLNRPLGRTWSPNCSYDSL